MPECRKSVPFYAVAVTALAFATAASAGARQPDPYEAFYDVYMDGKLRLEARVSVAVDGPNWRLHSTSKGVRGLARFLNANIADRSDGLWQDDAYRAASFQHASRVAGRKDEWSARFDWDRGVVVTRHEDGESTLEVDRGTADPLSLTLDVRQRLRLGQDEWDVRVVDEDQIDVHTYRVAGSANLATVLGCLKAVHVERVRKNSKRYSSGWYAPALDFIPVRILHGKRGGKSFEMRIRQLTVAGERIGPGADCLEPGPGE